MRLASSDLTQLNSEPWNAAECVSTTSGNPGKAALDELMSRRSQARILPPLLRGQFPRERAGNRYWNRPEEIVRSARGRAPAGDARRPAQAGFLLPEHVRTVSRPAKAASGGFRGRPEISEVGCCAAARLCSPVLMPEELFMRARSLPVA